MLSRLVKSLAASSFVCSSIAMAEVGAFLPPNELHLEEVSAPWNIDRSAFDTIINKADSLYQPIMASHGVTLRFMKYWTNNTVNAYASQNGRVWTVSMYGGLARRPEITPDGFATVLCHEIGHHLAGFPFVNGSNLSNEGQSDYFATLTCLRRMWADEEVENAKAREFIDATPRALCDEVWSTEAAQNLCYRTMLAGKSAAELLGALSGQSVSFEKDDRRSVTRTSDNHPAAQCRLDTYEAGALCNAEFDVSLIPGKKFANRNGVEAEKEALIYSCAKADEAFARSLRPRCWFAPRAL